METLAPMYVFSHFHILYVSNPCFIYPQGIDGNPGPTGATGARVSHYMVYMCVVYSLSH